MKKQYFIFAVLLSLSSISFAQNEIKISSEIFDPLNVDAVAAFPGGRKELNLFLGNNMTYPERAVKDSIQGKCYIRFVVSYEGKISDVKVLRGVPNCPECDAEAVRVVRSMPRWTPGTVKGKPINCYFDLPINFTMK